MQAPRYDDAAIDDLIWQAIRDSESPNDFRSYLDHRPENSAHLDEALDRLVELDDSGAEDSEDVRRYPAALAAIEALASAGNATAQFHMGKVLGNGLGVPIDIGRSVAWYRLAILQGELRSHINFAGTLLTGDASSADIAEAATLYAKAADLGEPSGVFHLGWLAATGRNQKDGRRDPARGFELFHHAWDAGEPVAGYWIGHMLLTGEGVRRDVELGREWIARAAEAGCIDAIRQLGRECENGRWGKADASAAAAWYRRGAASGDIECQARLGRILLEGEGIARDGAQAVQWLKRAALRGSAYAQRTLGLAYLWGIDVVKNPRFGRRWLTRAAAADDPESCCQLGRLLQEGENSDLAEAAQWFEKGARLGSSSAQTSLGFCYRIGRGVEPDPHSAYKWAQLAALQGDPKGLHLLGRLHQEGYGVEADFGAAARQFMRAAQRGYAPAQARLGWCYLGGRGVDKDVAEGMV
jgi:TPR repeat protein